jgi:hypothetical protein
MFGCLIERGVKAAPAIVGWTCPKCGAGLNPSINICPCASQFGRSFDPPSERPRTYDGELHE